MRIGANDRGIGEILEADNEHGPPAGARRGGDLAGKRAAAGENAERPRCLIFHRAAAGGYAGRRVLCGGK